MSTSQGTRISRPTLGTRWVALVEREDPFALADTSPSLPVAQASIYVPSVGQMTIAMLQRNLLRLRKYRNLMDKQEESPF